MTSRAMETRGIPQGAGPPKRRFLCTFPRCPSAKKVNGICCSWAYQRQGIPGEAGEFISRNFSPYTLDPSPRSQTVEHLPEARVESPPLILIRIGPRHPPPRYATAFIARNLTHPCIWFMLLTPIAPIVPAPPQGEPHPPPSRYLSPPHLPTPSASTTLPPPRRTFAPLHAALQGGSTGVAEEKGRGEKQACLSETLIPAHFASRRWPAGQIECVPFSGGGPRWSRTPVEGEDPPPPLCLVSESEIPGGYPWL